VFRSLTVGLFVVYAFANRVARSGAEAVSNTTFYIYRKVRGRNFPSVGGFLGIILVFTMYGVTKGVTKVTK